MKKIAQITFLAFAMFAFTSVSAQQDANPEVARYAKILDLNEKQVAQLTEMFAKGAEQDKALKQKIATHRSKMSDTSVSPDEKAKWKEDMGALSEDRRNLRESRQDGLVSILSKEQLAVFEKWKSGSMTREEIKQKMAE